MGERIERAEFHYTVFSDMHTSEIWARWFYQFRCRRAFVAMNCLFHCCHREQKKKMRLRSNRNFWGRWRIIFPGRLLVHIHVEDWKWPRCLYRGDGNCLVSGWSSKGSDLLACLFSTRPLRRYSVCIPHALLVKRGFPLSRPVAWLCVVGVQWLEGSRACLTFL